MSLALKSVLPYLVLAPANTSAGAPCWIWATSVSVPWKLKTNFTSLYCGLYFLKTGTIAGNALFSDAAANTLSFGAVALPDAALTPGTTSKASSASTSTTHDIFFIETLPFVPRPAVAGAARPSACALPCRCASAPWFVADGAPGGKRALYSARI